ncbi:MAG: hypothetical protein JW874_09230 [Spirochaetales bacterium]|nr:hypothetical protein [Spirochaetales bacterium]
MISDTRTTWTDKGTIYHIYPLGMLGAEKTNPGDGHIKNRLPALMNWVRYLKDLGTSCIYLGPVFSSESHGYDTNDYFTVDPRLGTNADLKALVDYFHQHDIRIILDAVFNHCGRGFFAFRDIQRNRQASPYCSWISGLDFGTNTGFNDGFSWDSWNGHHNLVKLNQTCPDVIDYFREVTEFWISEFNIDGLRFDAADVMDRSFLYALTSHAHSISDHFWTVGEVIHGDYKLWIREAGLDSVTNYEAYKSLYSSLNDKNYFELAWTLNRQFGEAGLYPNIPLYNFCDNHDVDRIYSRLHDKANIYPLHIALYTMPGIPVIYYGSENGITGTRTDFSDHELRPSYTIEQASRSNSLRLEISRLGRIRNENPALVSGKYRQLAVSHRQMAYSRNGAGQNLLVVLNSAPEESECAIPGIHGTYFDILNDEWCECTGKVTISPNWGRILDLASLP